MFKHYSYMTLVMLVLSSCSFNSENNEQIPAGISEKKFGVHTVTLENETPRMISEWYTGNAGNWVKFFVLKKSNSNSRFLPKGCEVYIPTEMVKQRLLLTEEFATAWTKKHKPIKTAQNGPSGNNKQSEKEPEREQEAEPNDTSSNEIEEQLIENLVGK